MNTVCNLLLVVALFALGAGGTSHNEYTVKDYSPPSGCEPAKLRAQLARVNAAEVFKACGTIKRPWAYRGAHGQAHVLEGYGRRDADAKWTRGFSSQLMQDAVLDTAYKQPSIVFSCDSADTVPIYFVRFRHAQSMTYAVLRFDLGSVLFYDDLEPLGLLAMGAGRDSLWSALGRVLDWDPLLRQPCPQPVAQRSTPFGSGASSLREGMGSPLPSGLRFP